MRTVRRVGDLRAALTSLASERGYGHRRESPSASDESPSASDEGPSASDCARTPSRSGATATIGLVPTMGALHEGHLSLIHHARAQCDVVVVSLFVNPSQFNEQADLDRYPRDEARDAALAAEAGADLLFAPGVEEVYPAGFATSVEVLGVTGRFEGASRGASHFRGVATVVTKLLCAVQPDVAYFGAKDAQQVVVIRRLVSDLNLPVHIATCPTVRDADGLALSSRNALLGPSQRTRALALPAALRAASELACVGERSIQALIAAATAAMAGHGVTPEYLAIVDPDSFEPLDGSLDRPGLLVLAARVDSVRLIDNTLLEPLVPPSPDHPVPRRRDPHHSAAAPSPPPPCPVPRPQPLTTTLPAAATATTVPTSDPGKAIATCSA